jgi:hypothetical protein
MILFEKEVLVERAGGLRGTDTGHALALQQMALVHKTLAAKIRDPSLTVRAGRVRSPRRKISVS